MKKEFQSVIREVKGSSLAVADDKVAAKTLQLATQRRDAAVLIKTVVAWVRDTTAAVYRDGPFREVLNADEAAATAVMEGLVGGN